MVFGRRWIKKEALRRLEAFAKLGEEKLQEACRMMEQEHSQRIQARGYELRCEPLNNIVAIRAVLNYPNKWGNWPTDEMYALAITLPPDFKGYEVHTIFTRDAATVEEITERVDQGLEL